MAQESAFQGMCRSEKCFVRHWLQRHPRAYSVRATIGAGGVVVDDIPPDVTAKGIPAKSSKT